MTLPLKYDAARSAIAECKSYDEVREWGDKAAALKEYARRAGDRTMIADCEEIRIRAARRQGELIAEMRATGTIRDGAGAKTVTGAQRITLADVGIDRRESMRCQQIAAIKPDEFEGLLSRGRARLETDDKRHVIDVLRERDGGDKAERRSTKERDLAAKIIALPKKKYGVILADPEWRFEPWSRETGMDRAADNHYPTSVLERIQQRDVQSIAADDCVLFLWATVPMLPHALMVMGAWGFDYKSHIAWAKCRNDDIGGVLDVGTGYWFRNAHELLLLGTRGKVPAPAPGSQWISVIRAPVGTHSEKPESALRMIESYFPSLPKIELNRRGHPRPGWDAWGAEAEVTEPTKEPVLLVPSHRNGEGEPVSDPGLGAGSPFLGPDDPGSHPVIAKGVMSHTYEPGDITQPASEADAPVQADLSSREFGAIPDFLRR